MKKLLLTLLTTFSLSGIMYAQGPSGSNLPKVVSKHVVLEDDETSMLVYCSKNLDKYQERYQSRGLSLSISKATNGKKYIVKNLSWVYDPSTENITTFYYDASEILDTDEWRNQCRKEIQQLNQTIKSQN